MMTKNEAANLVEGSGNPNGTGMKTRIVVLIAMLVMSSHSGAWIAYGFKSGMSRFDVVNYLSAKESFVITDGAQQTYAGPRQNKKKYTLLYCSKPQKLYLMQFSLDDSLAQFVQTRKKYEKRYGKPNRLDYASSDGESGKWEDVDMSLIWDLNESETIVLSHDKNGTTAEFRDVSVCQ